MPSWRDMQRYLKRNGWKLDRSGKHNIYKKDGRTIKTSHGSGEIPARIWREILKHELHITQEEFNEGLK